MNDICQQNWLVTQTDLKWTDAISVNICTLETPVIVIFANTSSLTLRGMGAILFCALPTDE